MTVFHRNQLCTGLGSELESSLGSVLKLGLMSEIGLGSEWNKVTRAKLYCTKVTTGKNVNLCSESDPLCKVSPHAKVTPTQLKQTKFIKNRVVQGCF